jgi:hypothetical protein
MERITSAILKQLSLATMDNSNIGLKVNSFWAEVLVEIYFV